MTDLSLPMPTPSPLVSRRWGGRLVVTFALVVLGDWLFWGQSIGLSLPIFVGMLAVAVIAANRVVASRAEVCGASILLVGSLLPALEATGPLATCFAAVGLAIFALVVAGQGTPEWVRRPFEALRLLLAGPARLVSDVRRVAAHNGPDWSRRSPTAALVGWIVPLGMLGLFGVLLADANPIMQRWLAGLDPTALIRMLDVGRVLVWLLLLSIARPFVAVRLAAVRPPPAAPDLDAMPEAFSWMSEHLLGRSAITRSLLLFNLLFAVQTGLDAIYLWGGAELPAGTTYASYAHRGAYPLIVTALLAGGFVLVAMRPFGPAERSPSIRPLVYLFVAQNVGLVLSSILRLELYVAVYSLTGLRLAAFVWMGLVLVGLCLIAARIALGRSNRWLVRANLLVVAATLYGSCLVDSAAVIASFNLVQQGKDPAARLDLGYLACLGSGAIPAIDRALAEDGVLRKTELAAIRSRLAGSRRVPRGWRDLDGRTWRLEAYLQAHPYARMQPAPAPVPVEPSPGDR